MNWKAALYGRVSTDHEEQQESIRVQRQALVKYAEGQGFEITDYYFDEGYTGTDFKRPEIIRLKKDIAKKKVNLVLVKDLSRIGRNNSLTLLFLDYLLENRVRLIAINDCYDTLKDEDGLVGIKTWVNERYSRDLSKKIKFALKHKKSQGEYIVPFAPYGYKKSPYQKNKLEIDLYAAEVVREIFNLYIRGFGFAKIASILEHRGVLNPSRYGCYGKKSHSWEWTTIKKIISNPVYKGDAVQQKYRKVSFKNKSIEKVPSSEWIVVENTHDPIIERAVFDMAQSILEKRKKYIKYRNGPCNPHLFTSFLYCHECGSPLYFKRDKKGEGGYRCGNYVRYGCKYCSSHYVREEDIKEVLVCELKSIINGNIDLETLINDAVKEVYPREENADEQLKLVNRELSKNEYKLEMLYKDKLDGIIGQELFLKIKEEIGMVSKSLKEQISSLTERVSCNSKYDEYKSTLVDEIRSIYEFSFGIDREVLEWFVKRIEVAEGGELIVEFNFFIP